MACPAGAVPNPSFDFFECACARFGLHVPTMILVYFNLNQPAHWHILSAVDGKPIIHLLLHASIPFFLSHLQFGTCYQHPSPLQLKVMEMDYSCVHCSWSNDCKRTFFPTMTKKRWEGRARKQNVVRACYCPSVQKPPVHPTWLALVRICPQHFHGKIPHQSHPFLSMSCHVFALYILYLLLLVLVLLFLYSLSISLSPGMRMWIVCWVRGHVWGAFVEGCRNFHVLHDLRQVRNGQFNIPYLNQLWLSKSVAKPCQTGDSAW